MQLPNGSAANFPRRKPNSQKPFARKYLSQVDPEDLSERTIDDLYGAVLSHLNFVRKHRRHPHPGIQPASRGTWLGSTHTVIEIVGDDMSLPRRFHRHRVNRQGLTLHLIIHPVMRLVRDARACCCAWLPTTAKGSTIHHPCGSRSTHRTIRPAGPPGRPHPHPHRCAPPRSATGQRWWSASTRSSPAWATRHRRGSRDIAEAKAFLEWLAADNFVLLGCRDYKLESSGGENELHIVSGSGLGLLRETGATHHSVSFAALPPQLKAQAHLPQLLTITKSNTRSTVHRQGYLDHIGVKLFDKKGKVVGERRIIGLLTSTAYNTNPKRIPLLPQGEQRHRACRLHARQPCGEGAGHHPRAISARRTFPDQHRRAVRQRHRHPAPRRAPADPPVRASRHLCALRLLPHLCAAENYNTEQRKRMQALLIEAFEGTTAEFEVHFSESALARILIIVRTPASRCRKSMCANSRNAW